MKVSLIQLNSGQDKAANLDHADRIARQVVDQEAPSLVVFPEHVDWLGGTAAAKLASGEAERDGPAYSMCRQLAIDCGIYVHSGSFYEKSHAGDRVFNTSVVFSPDGEEIARYRKIHLFDIVTPDGHRYGESDAVAPGTSTTVVEIEGLKFGLAICYDIRFPELFQQLVLDGAEVIVLPAAFTLQTGKDHWEVLCRARAIETQCYVVAPGQIGSNEANGQTQFTYGHSLVCDPWGHVIAKASDSVGHVSTRLDPSLVKKVREQIPLASHKVL